MSGEHARLSPSASKIWMACPGQPALAGTVVDETSSRYADEGTDAHWLAQGIITGEFVDTFEALVGPKGNAVTPAMLDAVMVYVDACRAEVQPDDDWAVEQRLHYSDDLWGTADFVRYRPSTGELLVADYKHGQGVPVEVENNPQALIYGLMKAKHLRNRGISSVTLMIVQPRCPHPDGPVRRWTFHAVDFLDFEDRLLDAIAATRAADAPLVAGDHCRWCRAKAICPALRAATLEQARAEFAPGLPYDPAALAAALDQIPLLETWIKATREFAYEEAMAGRVPAGWKLVEKRATRKWRDEASAAAMLELLMMPDEIYAPRTLLSPAKIEKALGKHEKHKIAMWTVAESSGLTLVHESDKRPAATPRASAAEDFSAA
jgi:hypothetical protein